MTDNDGEDDVYPGPIPLSQSVQTAIGYVVDLVHKERGTKQGKTPLYWALLYTCVEHAGTKPQPEKSKDEARRPTRPDEPGPAEAGAAGAENQPAAGGPDAAGRGRLPGPTVPAEDPAG